MLKVRYVGAVASAALLAGALATPAYADHTRAHTCQQAGGTFDAGATTQPGDDTCVVTTRSTVLVPVGTPTTTFGESTPSGDSTFTDSPSVPTGDPTFDSEFNDVGDPVTTETELLGTPDIDVTEQDAGEATRTPVTVPGTPSTSTRTVNGTPTSTDAAGTTNCKRVNDDNAKKPVERCDRTVVTTTVTPTTVFTTVTTPQTEVTTVSQPRETVTTTTTPVTPISTSVQQREECITTTQPTTFVRTTVQPTTRTQTVTQPRESQTTTTTTTSTFVGNGNRALLAPTGTVTTNTTSAPASDDVVTTTVVGIPIITPEPLEGESIVTGPVCTATTPTTTVVPGETFEREAIVVTEAAPVITTETRTLDPLEVTTSAAGTPIVDVQTRSTGETCFKNPSTAEQRRNRC